MRGESPVIPLIKTRMPEPQRLMPVLEQVLYSGYVAQGEKVELFERSFESFVGAGHSLSVNSGTAALHMLILRAYRKFQGTAGCQ